MRKSYLSKTGQGKTLLILGEPGSGKTITLLQLAEKLVNQTERDLTKPIPVVFNLSSWGQKHQPIEKWLIEEFKDKYQVPKTWSEPWLEQEQLILLLDGLDEVRAEQRNACVRALNQFIETHNITEIVVCSRVKDYEALTERLQLSSAICIKPLSPKQVYSFLAKAGDSLAGLKTLLKQDRELEQFAQTPLILNIMSLAYQDWSADDLLQQFRSGEDRYQHLFNNYIERMLCRRVIGQLKQNSNLAKYPQQKVLHWLSWLAKTMVDESKTVFLIEKMQSTLLSSTTEQNMYHLLVGLIVGLILGIAEGSYLIYLSFFYMNGCSSNFIPRILTTGILSGLISGVIFGILYIFNFHKLIKVLTSGVTFALTAAILFKLFTFIGLPPDKFLLYIPGFILVAALSSAVYSLIHEEIKPVEKIKFNPEQIKKFSILGLIVGVFYVLIRLILGQEFDSLYIVFEILICVIVFGIIGAFKIKQEISQAKARPNEGIKRGKKYALISFATIVPIATLTVWIMDNITHTIGNPEPELVYSIYIGLAFGFLGWLCAGEGSGIVLIQHYTLRLILYCKKYIPWNYARFLATRNFHQF